MSEITDRIADILGKHRVEAKSRTDACPDYPGFLTWHDGCICGWIGHYRHDDEQFNQHLAVAVVEELGLRELVDNQNRRTCYVTEWEDDVSMNEGYKRVSTTWEGDPDKPAAMAKPSETYGPAAHFEPFTPDSVPPLPPGWELVERDADDD